MPSKNTRAVTAVLMLMLLSGCSIKQQVDPAALSATLAPDICLIPGKGVREGFTTAYGDALRDKGFSVRTLHMGASPSRCQLSSTYTGNWSWDLAMYMSYADIRVFERGRQVGKAVYDSRSGGSRLDKFISAESKIIELTDQLFPTGASGLGRAPAPLPAAAQEQVSKEQQLHELRSTPGLSYEEYTRRYKEITHGQ
ncbi:Sbal_3080 family lipoprotein [uncultured Pseudomonas sp.]|uniref:Sbal_3080 family lipoprotein n=1 Tax=uncultured Pseudomonas sp. TaxID=114707 RepID=UPI0030D985E6